MRAVVGLVAVVAVVVGAGCASARLVAARAAEDMSCPEKDIEVVSREMGAYDAKGCGRKLSYVVRGGEVITDDGSELAESRHGD